MKHSVKVRDEVAIDLMEVGKNEKFDIHDTRMSQSSKNEQHGAFVGEELEAQGCNGVVRFGEAFLSLFLAKAEDATIWNTFLENVLQCSGEAEGQITW